MVRRYLSVRWNIFVSNGSESSELFFYKSYNKDRKTEEKKKKKKKNNAQNLETFRTITINILEFNLKCFIHDRLILITIHSIY